MPKIADELDTPNDFQSHLKTRLNTCHEKLEGRQMIGCVDSCPHFADDASGKTRNLGGNYKSSLLILSKCLKLKTKKKKKYNCCFMTPLTLKSGSL